MKLKTKLKAERPVELLHPFKGLPGFLKAHLGVDLEIAFEIPEGVLNALTPCITHAMALQVIQEKLNPQDRLGIPRSWPLNGEAQHSHSAVKPLVKPHARFLIQIPLSLFLIRKLLSILIHVMAPFRP
jgi:hypothetical protein